MKWSLFFPSEMSDIVMKYVDPQTGTCSFNDKDYFTGYDTTEYKETGGDAPNPRMCTENNASWAVINDMDALYK